MPPPYTNPTGSTNFNQLHRRVRSSIAPLLLILVYESITSLAIVINIYLEYLDQDPLHTSVSFVFPGKIPVLISSPPGLD